MSKTAEEIKKIAGNYCSDNEQGEYIFLEENLIAMMKAAYAQQPAQPELPLNVERQVSHEDEKEVMIRAFNKVRQLFEQRQWVMDGRGSYPYNDDRYKQEVRFLYDEFDALQKDTWKNIKSYTCDYRKKIIDEYLSSQQPAQGEGENDKCDNCGGTDQQTVSHAGYKWCLDCMRTAGHCITCNCHIPDVVDDYYNYEPDRCPACESTSTTPPAAGGEREHHATSAMFDDTKQLLIELMADFLDSESVKLNEAIGLISDPIDRNESELHIRMASAAFEEYKKTVTV